MVEARPPKSLGVWRPRCSFSFRVGRVALTLARFGVAQPSYRVRRTLSSAIGDGVLDVLSSVLSLGGEAVVAPAKEP